MQGAATTFENLVNDVAAGAEISGFFSEPPGAEQPWLPAQLLTAASCSDRSLLHVKIESTEDGSAALAAALTRWQRSAEGLAPTVWERALPVISRYVPDLAVQPAMHVVSPSLAKTLARQALEELLAAVAAKRSLMLLIEGWCNLDAPDQTFWLSVLATAPTSGWLGVVFGAKTELSPGGEAWTDDTVAKAETEKARAKAETALDRGDPTEARRQLRFALIHAGGGHQADARAQRRELLVRLSEAERRLENTVAARRLLEEARALARTPEERVDGLLRLANVAPEAAIDLRNEAMVTAEAAQNPVLVASCALALGYAHAVAGAIESAATMFERASAAAQEARVAAGNEHGRYDDIELEARSYLGQLHASFPFEHAQRGIDQLRQAIVLRRGKDDRPGLLHARWLLGFALATLGEHQEAQAAYEEARQLAVQHADANAQLLLGILQAEVTLDRGLARQAAAMAEEALRQALADRERPREAWHARVIKAAAQVRSGSYQEGLMALEILSREAPGEDEARSVLARLAEAAVFSGRHAWAREATDALDGLITSGKGQDHLGRLLLLQAELAVREVRPERAAKPLAMLAPAAARSRGLRAQVCRVSALVALATGRRDEARAYAAEGRELARAIGATGLQAELAGLMGQTWREAAPEALESFTEMARLAREAGVPLWERRADAWIETLSRKSPVNSTAGASFEGWTRFACAGYVELPQANFT